MIESKNVVFLKNTGLTTLIDLIDLLNGLENKQVSITSNDSNINFTQVHNNESSKKFDQNQYSSINFGDSGSNELNDYQHYFKSSCF